METLLELLARIATAELVAALSDDELAEIQAAVIEQLADIDPDQVDGDTLTAIAQADEAMALARAETETRTNAAAERAVEAEERLARIRGEQAPAEGEGEGEGGDETPPAEGEGEGETPPAEGAETETPPAEGAEGEQTPEAVAAAAAATPPARTRPRIEAAASRIREGNRPQRRAAARRNGDWPEGLAVVAAAEVDGMTAGGNYRDWRQLANAMAQRMEATRAVRRAGAAGRFGVATVRLDIPDNRRLRAGDAQGNRDRIDAWHDERPALVAAGGFCAPFEADYGLMVDATDARPVRDALNRFGADRGGIRFITPPQLADVESAVGVWTSSDDESATDGDPTKNVLRITCGTEVECETYAVTLRLKTGNFSRRTFPEQFPAWFRLALAQHARIGERELLDAISTGSTAVTDGQNLGATRDVLELWGRLAAQYRNRMRLEANATLNALLPAWLLDAMVADLARQLPGDEALNVARDTITGYLAARDLDVSWYLDERTGADQIYAAQGAGAALTWKSAYEGYLFHPTTWTFLDGGELDLGTEIRDSTLNATNDVESFFETFEGACKTGIQTSLRVRGNICVSGASSATEDINCLSPAS